MCCLRRVRGGYNLLDPFFFRLKSRRFPGSDQRRVPKREHVVDVRAEGSYKDSSKYVLAHSDCASRSCRLIRRYFYQFAPGFIGNVRMQCPSCEGTGSKFREKDQ